MCDLNQAEREAVVSALFHLIQKGRPFTGQDVAKASQVAGASPAVRELFNGGVEVFDGWAAMKINGNNGPLLYFRVPKASPAGKAAEKIRGALQG